MADEAEDEEDEQEQQAEAPPVVVTPAAAKKRGRPAGSKNRAPDVYTALLDRMSQLEETLRRPESSTGGHPKLPQRQIPKGRPGQDERQWKRRKL